jgi:hypothetical protein
LSGENCLRGIYSADVFEKLKQFIRAGRNNIIELFKQADVNQTGRVSAIEFRNVIKKLNLGLTSIEVNQLLDFADIFPDGTVDWKSFINRILLKESEARIFSRCKERLSQLKHNITGYLITPKDAFHRVRLMNYNHISSSIEMEMVASIMKNSPIS